MSLNFEMFMQRDAGSRRENAKSRDAHKGGRACLRRPELMPNIKRRDKRRNNSATFNKRDCGIGWVVGSNQVSGSLGLHVYAFGTFTCTHILIYSDPWIKPTSIVMNHYRRSTYYYCCHRIFIFILISTLFPIFSPWVSNRIICSELCWICFMFYSIL